jgi:hypothetical protein
MAGKIVADTLEHSTAGSIATNYVVKGSAKGSVIFDADGIEDAEGITSFVDNGTGDYSFSITNAMSDVNYRILMGNSSTTTNNGNATYFSKTTSSFNVKSFRANDGTLADLNTGSTTGGCSVAILGDLA